MTEESVKDKIARQDHDAIIRMEGKIDNLSTDFKIYNDSNAVWRLSVEKDIVDLKKSRDENTAMVKGIRWFLLAIGGLVTFILTVVTNVIKIGK